MKLVIVILFATCLAFSSAATTKRPVEEKETIKSIEPVAPVVPELSEEEIVKIVEDTLKEELGDLVDDDELNDDEEKDVDGDEETYDNDETDDDDNDDDDDDDDVEETDDNEVQDGSDTVDGVDIQSLTDEEVESLIEAENEILKGYLDVYVGAKEIQEKLSGNHKSRRPKRWVPLAIGAGRIAFSAGRALFSRFARNGITRSGSRITKHYSRPGNYFTARREFLNLKPTNVKPIGGSKFNGWTGTSGPYRVTVRNGSKGTSGTNGSPTLSISSKGGNLVRKFRFD